MKYYISIFALMLFTISVSAQEKNRGERRHDRKEKRESKIAAKKVGYFTEELNLTAQEAQNFWPLYNDFQDKMKSLKDESKESMANEREFSDEQGEAYINDIFNKEQKVLDLKRSYYKKFETALPKAKIAKLYVIERKFRDKIYSTLKKRMRGKNKGK